MANEEKPSKKQIFIRNLKPLTFYIIPCKRKRELTNLVVQHGGKMSKDRLSAQYQLYVPGDIVSNPKMVSSMFIEDSIQAESLLDVEKYRYAVREKVEKKMLENEEQASDVKFAFKEEPVSPQCSSRPKVRTRLKEYTVDEDMGIIEAVLKQSKHHSINGTRLWDSLVAQKVTKRTGMSMKERFMKKILPFVENYNLSAVELKKLKSLSSAKTNQVRSKVGYAHRKASLPFLQAPKPLLKAPDPYAESFSSDDSLGSLVAPHTRIARKRKPILMELSSNSSQSGDSQQHQGEETRQGKDRLQVQPPEERRLSKSDRKRSPRSTTVPQTSRSRSDSVASYVIEETPPDVEPPSSLAKMNELTQSDDLDLLAPPIKLIKRGTRANNAKSTGKSNADVDSKLAANPIVLLTDSSDCASVLSPGLTSMNSSQNSPVKRYARESTESPKTPSVGRSPVTPSKQSTESLSIPRVDRQQVIPGKRVIRQRTASPKTMSTRSNVTPAKRSDKQSNDGQNNLTRYPETQPFTIDEIAAGTQQFSVTEGMEECVPIPGSRPPLSDPEESQNTVDAFIVQSPLLFVEQSPLIVNDLPAEGPERVLASSGSSLESLGEFLRPMTQQNDDCGVPGQRSTSDSILAMGEGRWASSILSGPTDASTQKPSSEDEVDDPPLTWSTFDYASAGSAQNDGATAIGLHDIRTSSPNLPVNKSTNSLELFPPEAAPAGGDELINQSWTDDEQTTPEPTRPTSPPPLLRSNRLKEVLSQPLKQPQYEDANETFTSSQGSLYVSCLSADAPPSKQSKSSVKVEVRPSPKKPIPPPSGPRQEEPVATTSRHQDTEQRVNLFINKCEACVKNPRKVCHINELKSHAMYSKLMFTFGVEDKILLAFVLALSADWELIEQHFKSDGKVGVMWTQKDDRLLTNPSFRKRNLKELRKKFSAREIKARKQFLLQHVQLTPKQRQLLMGMAQ